MTDCYRLGREIASEYVAQEKASGVAGSVMRRLGSSLAPTALKQTLSPATRAMSAVGGRVLGRTRRVVSKLDSNGWLQDLGLTGLGGLGAYGLGKYWGREMTPADMAAHREGSATAVRPQPTARPLAARPVGGVTPTQ